MNFELYELDRAHEVKALFTDVFSESEGKKEGELIGNLALQLQETSDPDDIYGFIARDGETIAGCIFFTRITFEDPVNAFILSPVAIATKYQGQGAGQKLITFGIDYLRNQNVELVFTYGDPDFYSRTGFRTITEDIAKAPFKLTYPQGWLAQSLVGDRIDPLEGTPTCVSALNRQQYW